MYSRPIIGRLSSRLLERPTRIQILAGPRQVGKTTLIRQLLAERPVSSWLYIATDQPGRQTAASASLFPPQPTTQGMATSRGTAWLIDQWRDAEKAALAWHTGSQASATNTSFVFVIDEIQKIPQWSETIKGLWDRQIGEGEPIHLVLLGSSPLLMQHGLTESLAGRYEIISLPHWSFEEMNDAFGFTLDQYLYFGGFPGSAAYVHDESRWQSYVSQSLIEPNIERDILMMNRIVKPALLRQLFGVGCAYSAQIVSLDKTLGQLHDAGNVTTLSRYLELLGQAGLVIGLSKYSGHDIRRRKSPPKFQVLNTGLMSATGSHSFEEARADRSHWGRLVESAIGAHLLNTADGNTRIHYWREGTLEVDYIIEHRGRLTAIEVKSGKVASQHRGLAEFSRRHNSCATLLVGSERLSVGEFLKFPAAHWAA